MKKIYLAFLVGGCFMAAAFLFYTNKNDLSVTAQTTSHHNFKSKDAGELTNPKTFSDDHVQKTNDSQKKTDVSTKFETTKLVLAKEKTANTSTSGSVKKASASEPLATSGGANKTQDPMSSSGRSGFVMTDFFPKAGLPPETGEAVIGTIKNFITR